MSIIKSHKTTFERRGRRPVWVSLAALGAITAADVFLTRPAQAQSIARLYKALGVY